MQRVERPHSTYHEAIGFAQRSTQPSTAVFLSQNSITRAYARFMKVCSDTDSTPVSVAATFIKWAYALVMLFWLQNFYFDKLSDTGNTAVYTISSPKDSYA